MGKKSGELTLGGSPLSGGRKRDGGLRECGYLGPPWQVTVTSGQKIWYFVGANMPPNDLPAVHWITNELAFGPESVGKLLVGDLNACLKNPRDQREDHLATVLAGYGLTDQERHFIRGGKLCTEKVDIGEAYLRTGGLNIRDDTTIFLHGRN